MSLELISVSLASFLAGAVDAIVGGGGLILLPALFAAFPAQHHANLLGVNKATSIWGTAAASLQYAKRVRLSWVTLGPALLACWAASGLGAWVVIGVSTQGLRMALPWVLLALLAYTLKRKDLGQTHTPHWSARQERWILLLIGGCIGFYDGFFGPGTGSFLIFLMVRFLGYDFLNASAAAKLLNLASNLAAVSLFAWLGHIAWSIVMFTAVANVMGSLLGTRMALKHGAGFVRGVFIWVVLALILKTGYDAYRPLWLG